MNVINLEPLDLGSDARKQETRVTRLQVGTDEKLYEGTVLALTSTQESPLQVVEFEAETSWHKSTRLRLDYWFDPDVPCRVDVKALVNEHEVYTAPVTVTPNTVKTLHSVSYEISPWVQSEPKARVRFEANVQGLTGPITVRTVIPLAKDYRPRLEQTWSIRSLSVACCAFFWLMVVVTALWVGMRVAGKVPWSQASKDAASLLTAIAMILAFLQLEIAFKLDLRAKARAWYSRAGISLSSAQAS